MLCLAAFDLLLQRRQVAEGLLEKVFESMAQQWWTLPTLLAVDAPKAASMFRERQQRRALH